MMVPFHHCLVLVMEKRSLMDILSRSWLPGSATCAGGHGHYRFVLLQVDLGTPSFPHRLLNTVARRQAAVIADLDVFLAKSAGLMKTHQQ